MADDKSKLNYNDLAILDGEIPVRVTGQDVDGNIQITDTSGTVIGWIDEKKNDIVKDNR